METRTQFARVCDPIFAAALRTDSTRIALAGAAGYHAHEHTRPRSRYARRRSCGSGKVAFTSPFSPYPLPLCGGRSASLKQTGQDSRWRLCAQSSPAVRNRWHDLACPTLPLGATLLRLVLRLDSATSRVYVLSPTDLRRTQHARLTARPLPYERARSRTPHLRVVRMKERLLDFASSSAFCETSDKVHLSSMLLRGRHCRGKIEEGRGRQQPRKPRSWATPERFLSSPRSLCSISSHSSVPRDYAYRLLLKAYALLPPNPQCHAGRRLPVGRA